MTHNARKTFLLRLCALLLGGGLMASVIAPAGRSLTGDAPALLGRARRMRDALAGGDPLGALAALAGQVVPQPPLGYAMAATSYLLGLEHAAALATSLAALAMIGVGLTWCAQGSRSPLGLAPLAAGLMLLATPMTWAAAEHVQWDLLCAGWITLSLGALVRSEQLSARRWTLAAGGLAGLAALVKYNAPLFLWLPLLLAVISAARSGRRRDAVALIVAGAAPLLLWLPLALSELGPYLAASAGGSPGVDSASAVPPLSQRLGPEGLAYYPAVLKDAIGWPGVAVALGALGAWRLPAGRVLWLAMLGGGISLALIGRREPRYLWPLLPLLFLAAELGWGQLQRRGARAAAGAVFVVVFGAQLWGTATAYKDWTDLRPLAELAFGTENLTRFGQWPSPEPAFVPTSTLAETWKVAPAVDAIATVLPDAEHATVGLLLYSHPRVPPPDLFGLEAARRGWVWDRVELEILSAHRGGPPPPGVQPGRVQGMGGAPDPNAPRLPGQPPPRPPEEEEFLLQAHRGPVPSLVGEDHFVVLYAVHPRGEPFYRAFFLQLGAEAVEVIPLPRGFAGTVWRLDASVWEGVLGQQIQDAVRGQ